MKILCAIGLRGGLGLIRRIVEIHGTRAELILLHVIDTRPHHDLDEILRTSSWGRQRLSSGENELLSAEQAAGRAAIDEAVNAAKDVGFQVGSAKIARGKPEHVIVDTAGEQNVDLIVIRAREGSEGHPHIGPESVGHTARFVLDHAPCDVLLLRETEATPGN